MTMPASRVARPSTTEEAVRLLADNGPEAVIIAGGTDVVPNLQMKLFTPRVLVDIKPIRALQGITIAAAGALRLGALTTLTEIVGSPLLQASYPVLVSAAATIAGPLRSEEHTSELQSPCNLVCRLLLEKKKNNNNT